MKQSGGRLLNQRRLPAFSDVMLTPDQCRARAHAVRQLAKRLKDANLRDLMERVAKQYDRMAADVAALARDTDSRVLS